MERSQRKLLTISPFVREIENDSGAALLDVKQGLCFSLNPVGARIWGMLKLRHHIDDIVARLVVDFGLPYEQLHQDLLEFIEGLKQARLLIEIDHKTKSGRFDRVLALVQRLRESTCKSSSQLNH